MSSTEALLDEVEAAIASGQYRLAALTAAEAIERATDTGDVKALVDANYWAAQAARILGNYPKALQHIIDGEHSDTSISLSLWRRRQIQFAILSAWRPYQSDLKRKIDELGHLQRQFAAPKGDIGYLEAVLYDLVGDWASALRQASQSFRKSLGNENGGVVTYGHAEICAAASIQLHDFSAAADWISSVRVEENIDAGWEPLINASQATLWLQLARARGADVAELRARLGAVEDACRRIDDERQLFSMHSARFRVALLDPSNGDPETLWHPARAACCYRFKERLNVHRRYVHNLQVLDLRLAAVRYACGLTPVDDQFAPPPSVPLSCATHPELNRRLRRARAALAVAYGHARRIDTMLECTWREEEVSRRAAWIEAIAAAVGTPALIACEATG